MQIIVGGLIFGCIYGLTALGLVLIYKTTDLVNFAHGEMAMVSTFVSFVLLSQLELNYFLTLLLTLVFSALFGILVYYAIMKWARTAPQLNQLVLTIGLFLIFNGVAGLIWGYQPTTFPEAVPGKSFEIGNVFITPNEVFILFVTFVLMMGFFLLFRYTKIGLAMRAASQDMVATELMGIKVNNIFMVAWGIGTVLGGVAGVMTAPITFLSPNMMADILIMGFAGAVVGGFSSLPGAVIGGLIIGVFESHVSYYFAPEWKLVAAFLLIVFVLYIRPQGIFGGVKSIKKV